MKVLTSNQAYEPLEGYLQDDQITIYPVPRTVEAKYVLAISGIQEIISDSNFKIILARE